MDSGAVGLTIMIPLGGIGSRFQKEVMRSRRMRTRVSMQSHRLGRTAPATRQPR
jgi:hypothetical protein